MISLAAPDATMYWLSRRTLNDQFLLYCFAESDRDSAALRAEIGDRCAEIPELRVRLHDDPTGLAYPMWVPAAPGPDHIVEHHLDSPRWADLLPELGRLIGTGVDARVRPWRWHLFRGIRDGPAPDASVTVAVLQISHALVDGRGAAAIARAVFTGPPPKSRSGPAAPASPPAISPTALRAAAGRRTAAAALTLPVGIARTVRRGLDAARARTELEQLTAAGQLAAPGAGYPPGPLNGPARVAGHTVRMVVCPAIDFRAAGFSVTVLGLTAVSLALARYLRARGVEVTRLGAQVPMALSPRPGVRNNYRGLGVDLAAGDSDLPRRAATIAAELAARRERARHPLQRAQDTVTAVLPPLLLRRDVAGYPIHTLPDRITGHTVVSSVDRGAADLQLGGAPVRFTAGFPALGSVMHLTHGIHGLGETVTLSVHADPQVMPDIDDYTERLRAAVRETAERIG